MFMRTILLISFIGHSKNFLLTGMGDYCSLAKNMHHLLTLCTK